MVAYFMALTIDMVIALHSKATGKINLTYRRPGGTMGYCYIDPTKPMCAGKNPLSGGTLIQYLKQDQFKVDDKIYMTFYKQQSNAQLMLNIAEVDFQNKNRKELLELIYGSK